MKQRRVWAIAVGILLCQLTSGDAFALDLNLSVPVKLSNLRSEVVSVWLNCKFMGDNNKDFTCVSTYPLSKWPVPAPVNGAVNATVVVGCNLPDAVKSLYTKYSYSCNVHFGDGTNIYVAGGSMAPWTGIMPGSANKLYIYGDFP